VRSGIAVANPSGAEINVGLELTGLDGTPTGLNDALAIPANGQRALFLNEIPGFASLSAPFQGVLRIWVDGARTVSVAALRGRINERGDFLMTTTMTENETSAAGGSELLLPHFAEGGGYSMQFILFSGREGTSPGGAMYFFDQYGRPAPLSLR
jgi:hypothetical protein